MIFFQRKTNKEINNVLLITCPIFIVIYVVIYYIIFTCYDIFQASRDSPSSTNTNLRTDTLLKVDFAEIGHSSGDNNDEYIPIEKSYLLYQPKWGFTNQLYALHGAFSLAHATNRTLVLPPILPHSGEPCKDFDWSSFRGLPKPIGYINKLKEDALKVATGKRFPSFTAVVNFELMKQQFEEYQSYIDFPEFMKLLKEKYYYLDDGNIEPENPTIEESKWKAIIDQHFYSGNSTKMEEMISSRTITWTKLLEGFQENFGKTEIAVIGAGFDLKLKSPYELQRFPPSYEVSQVLKHVLSLLTPNYVGFHIRLNDRYTSKEPGYHVKNTFEVYFDSARRDMIANNVTRNDTIYLGSNMPTIKKYFLAHTTEEEINHSNVVTLSDLVEKDQNLHRLMNNIRSEWSTNLLVVDQFMYSLSTKLVIKNAMNGGSTFQRRISSWNRHRDELLSIMENSRPHNQTQHFL